MVHVDDVPRGLACGCVCPCCREKLLARHGDIKEHGFAHHSDNRGANLDICYRVVLYKLAEQIIQTRKKIHAPSYYGIFKEKDIEFVDVKIDGRYEREDKQPDVIATTKDNQQYIIEFTFDYKVQHKQAIDYKNLNCLEINLSNQTLESVEKFLLEENKDRIWFNNQECFDSIEPRYEKANKRIKVKNEDECKECELYYSCVGVRSKESGSILVIENSGNRYRICKLEQYYVAVEERRNRLKEAEERRNAFNQVSSYPMYKQKYREFADASEGRTRFRENKGRRRIYMRNLMLPVFLQAREHALCVSVILHGGIVVIMWHIVEPICAWEFLKKRHQIRQKRARDLCLSESALYLLHHFLICRKPLDGV